ncbi:MAG: PAS domain S-box protein [Bacteroidales bacterium]|nr:PAS domain S-box protein [Bacteroidales bacterium]
MSIIKSNKSKSDLKKEVSLLRKEIAKLKNINTENTKSIIDNANLGNSIFEDAGIGMAIIDNSLKVVKYNRAFYDLFGYNNNELVEMTYLDFIPEETKTKASQLFEAMFSSKISKYQTEQVYYKKDKSLLWLKLTVSVINNLKGEPEYILGMGEDITKLKKQENIRKVVYNISNAVNDSQSLYNLINTIKSNLKLIIDAEHFFIALYNEISDNFSVPYIIDKKESFKTFPAEKTLVGLVQKNRKSLLFDYKKILELQSAEEIFIAGNVSKQWLGVPLINDEKVIGVIGVHSYDNENAFDDNDFILLEVLSNQISASIQKTKSEEAFKIERAYFKELFDNSPEAIAIVDNSSIIININNEFTKLFGYTKDEAVNSTIEDLISTPESKDEAQNITIEVSKGKVVKTYTKRKKKDGSIVDVSLWGTPVMLDKGQLAVYAIFRDISERIEYENRLEKAKIKAEESDKLKTAFLTNMSHEIRTPMNAIIGFSELISDPGTDKETQKEFTEQIYNSSNMLLQLIEDIIDVSQLDSGNIKLNKKSVNISSLLTDLHSKYEKEKEKKKNIELLLHNPFGDSMAYIECDAYRFFQIFSNLLNNAFKYTNSGFIEYGFDINQKDEPVFYVRDTGIGIPEDKSESIFDHFTKIEDKKILYRGTGIGLTITKKLVNLLGGKIWVESNLDIGSIFYFTLPGKVILQEASNSKSAKHTHYNWIGKRFLVAEDDDINFAVVKASLTNTHANIQRVMTGEHAVQKCLNENFDIILMDLKMPVLSGIEATKQIRKFNSKIPILAQTAFIHNNEKDLCLMAGCNEYITKPTKAYVLLDIINKYISNAK